MPRSRALSAPFILAALLGCHAPDTTAPTETMPTVASETVEGWVAHAQPIILEALKSGRGGLPGQFRWTDTERAELERLREQARSDIAKADTQARPWLLVRYASTFYFFGLGTEYADALLELPAEHPAWAEMRRLLDVAWEVSDPAALDAYVHALAEHGHNPYLAAESLFLDLRDADRHRDWDRTRELVGELSAFSVEIQGKRTSVVDALNLDIDSHHPDRMLRAETRVPHFCAPALVGDERSRVCLDELFPATPTLIIGSASWCGACREAVPPAIARARALGVRGVLISYDQDIEIVRAYRVEYNIADWPTLMPWIDGGMQKPRVPGDLMMRPIPYLAMVDARGEVTIGAPWVDNSTLEEPITPSAP